MPDSSGDEHDSRTALVGQLRSRSNHSSRHASSEPPNKRQRRNRSPNVQDFVPQGATFSAKPLEIDPDTTSSSGSESLSDDSHSDSDRSVVDDEEQDAGSVSAPVSGWNPIGTWNKAGNWNKGNTSTIRTSLSSRRNGGDNVGSNKKATPSPFDVVNGTYWRSRSASASADGGDGDNYSETQARVHGDSEPTEDEDMEEGEVDENEESEESSAESSQSHGSGDSDDSESLDSEADDSILLNIGSKEGQPHNQALSVTEDDYDPETLPPSHGRAKDTSLDGRNGTMNGDSGVVSKEAAMSLFAKKYPAAPAVLADLERADMEMQARVIFYHQNINDINLQLPISCTECLKEGHLAEVCPMKECVHCGAWNQHQSSFCPNWRRCQRCRERGHDRQQCTFALKGSASETPCDLCGSSDHLELECDFMWKMPRQDTTSTPVLVSISCAHCTSSRHLMGDCPSLTQPLTSSSWTLRGIDPDITTNINSVVNPRKGGAAGGQRGMKIRGRADHQSPSPDSDDMLSRRAPQPVARNANRGNIRFGNGIGRNKNLGPPPPGPSRDLDSRMSYRDREDYPSRNNGHQRSLSPRPRGGRGRGKDSYQPHPRPARGGGDRGRGGGWGGSRRGGGNGQSYRPLPSAAKKAWDTYRLS